MIARAAFNPEEKKTRKNVGKEKPKLFITLCIKKHRFRILREPQPMPGAKVIQKLFVINLIFRRPAVQKTLTTPYVVAWLLRRSTESPDKSKTTTCWGYLHLLDSLPYPQVELCSLADCSKDNCKTHPSDGDGTKSQLRCC